MDAAKKLKTPSFVQTSMEHRGRHRHIRQHQRLHRRTHRLRSVQRLGSFGKRRLRTMKSHAQIRRHKSHDEVPIKMKRYTPREAALQVNKIMQHIKQLSPEVKTSDEPFDEDMQEEKCTINNNPNCEKFVDSMMTIVRETSCKMSEMELALQEAEEKCETIKGEYNSQIEDLQGRAYDASVDMANGIK